MAVFLFQAKTVAGKPVKGEVEAGSETEARVKLRSQQLVPIKIVAKSARTEVKKSINFGSDNVKPKELQIFTRQFAVLVGAGVPIVQSIEAMIGPGRSPGLNKALQVVLEDLQKGRRLGDALASHPRIFDRMYINLIRAGEEGGVLDQVLNRLAIYIEKSVALRSRITGALWYPAVVLVVAFGVIAGIMIFVIPSFVGMFASSNQELPALTLMVIGLSQIFVKYWIVIVLAAIITPYALKSYYGTPAGRITIDKIVIDIPIFGALIQKGAIARFSRTLSTLLAAGVRIIDALDIAGATAGNYVIESALLKAKDYISKGRTLAEPLGQDPHIPSMVTQMISVGEQTGNIDIMLGKVADFYEDEVEGTADAMSSLIEPILMVVLGVIVATIVIAMYLPIFNLAGAVGA